MSDNINTAPRKSYSDGSAGAETQRKGGSKLYSVLARIDWRTVGVLAFFVMLGAYLRIYFDFSQAIAGGYPGLSGGSDADYYFRVLRYALVTGHQLEFDPLLNYPLGARNPFLPFYVWTTVMGAWVISFLFHLPLITSIYSGKLSAGVAAYVMMSALSGVISIIIAYYLGKELFDKYTGIFAAGLMAFMPSIVSESTVGFGVHDPFILMMTALLFFFLFRSLNTVNGVRWVERWNRKGSILPDFYSIKSGLKNYFQNNKRSLTYALMAGIVLASIANAWEGFSYLLVIISVFYLVQSFIYKFKNRDTLALSAIWLVVSLSLLVFSLPIYFLGQHIYPWYIVAVAFFAGTVVLGAVYTVARDVPWLTLIVAILVGVGVILVGAEVLDRHIIHVIVGYIFTAQSYFIKTTVYTTIAEALAPPFSLLALSLGGSIFFIAFAELAYIFYISRRKISDAMTLFVVWSILAVFMAVTTVRFILDATTVFVILGGKGLVSFIRWTNFGEVKKGYQTYGINWSGTKKSVKLKHIIALFLIVSIVILPLVWSGIDAATPTTLKEQLNTQVYDILPSFLRPTGYTNNGSSTYYFGAFGYSLSTINDYFPAAWQWLYEQNKNITPAYDRPAYLSWWDYGSASITKAEVPAVADDFQQGYHFASAVLFSQNETQLIALLSARVMYGVYVHDGGSLPRNITSTLQGYGLNSSYIESVYRDPAQFTRTVLANPQIYGPFASNVAPPNVMWAVLMATISKIGLNNTVNLYQQLSQMTHYYIGYFSVDARLFPFSATDTGVFYAPALLGGRPMAGPTVYNIPYDYYTINATSSTGVNYPLQSIPPNTQVVSYSINYQPLFYNMTLYRFFMGYSAYDLTHQAIGGFPGLSGSFLSDPSLQNLQPLPGWMMSHFFMAYRTAYYNPYPIQYVKYHPNAWRAIDVSTALKLLKQDPNNQNYTVDLSPQSDYGNGIVIMEYYPGAYINGTVTYPNGQPASGVRATILDEWGIPHEIVYTNSQGRYSLIAPPGNDTVVFSTGQLSSPSSVVAGIGQVVGEQTYNVSYAEAMRYPNINVTTGFPAFNILAKPFTLNTTSINGYVFFDSSRSGTYTPGLSTLLTNVTVRIVNTTTGLAYNTSASDGHYDFSSILPGQYQFYIVKDNSTIPTQNITTVSYSTNTTQNIPVYPGVASGTVLLPDGSPDAGAKVTIQGTRNGYSSVETTASNGSYTFHQLLPGNYTLSVSGSTVSPFYHIHVRSLNTTAVNIVASPSVPVSGTVYLPGGVPAPFATIYFYSNEPGMQPFVVRTDSNGFFSAVIGSGNYTLYSVYYRDSLQSVLLTSLDAYVGHHSMLSLTLSPSSTLSGTIFESNGAPASFAHIYVQSGNSSLSVYADSRGNYSVPLPAGTYNLWVSTATGSYLSQVTLSTSGVRMDMHEVTSRLFDGQVGFISSGTNSYIAGARLTLYYNGIPYVYYSGLSGNYSFYLPQGISYGLNVSAFGMYSSTFTLGPSSPVSNDLTMSPVPVPVSGAIDKATVLPAGAEVTFTSVSDPAVQYNFTVNNGIYQALLLPGTYHISISNYSNSTTEYEVGAPSVISVPVGTPQYSNISVETLYNVTVTFTYPSGSGVGNNVSLTRLDVFSSSLSQPIAESHFSSGTALYVPAGVYTLYAYSSVSGSVFAQLDKFGVSGATPVSLKLGYAYNLTGAAYYNGTELSSETVTVTLASNDASVTAALSPDGRFAVSLPAGTYVVNVTYPTTTVISGKTAYVVYYGNVTVTLSSAMDVRVDTVEMPDNAHLSGYVFSYYGKGVMSTIRFAAVNGGENETVSTTSQGYYNISLVPGEYAVNTVSLNPLGSNYTTVYLTAGQSLEMNQTLLPSYNISGTASVAGTGRAPSFVHIRGNGMNFNVPVSGGLYSITLPEGNYSLSSSYSYTAYGTKYVYEYEGNVSLRSSIFNPIVLNLKPVYSVSVSVISDSAVPGVSGFSRVTLRLTNTGDVPASFALRIATSGWYGSFTPSLITLGTGLNSSATVTAELYPSQGVSGGNSTVYLQAYSPYSPSSISTVSVTLSVPPTYTFYSKFDFYQYEQPGRVFAVNLQVFNTGNSQSEFTAMISNYAELRQEGWNGGISTAESGPFTSGSTTFTLGPGQNQSITISLTANSSTTPNMVPIGFTVVNSNTNQTSSMSVPISLPSPTVSLSGIGVSGHGASASPLPLFTARRGVIIFLLAAFIIADVYLAKKKRLIR